MNSAHSITEQSKELMLFCMLKLSDKVAGLKIPIFRCKHHLSLHSGIKHASFLFCLSDSKASVARHSAKRRSFKSPFIFLGTTFPLSYLYQFSHISRTLVFFVLCSTSLGSCSRRTQFQASYDQLLKFSKVAEVLGRKSASQAKLVLFWV